MAAMGNVVEDLDLDYSPEKPFVFYASVPTLQSIASHEVALLLWNHYLSRLESEKVQKKFNFKSLWFASNLTGGEGCVSDCESDKLAESLKMPSCIEAMLTHSLKRIRCEMDTWLRHFETVIFCDRFTTRNRLWRLNPNHCVWQQNNEIDYKRSVSKMILSDEGKLEAEQKFVIMCFYGMADELKTFPVTSLSGYFLDYNYFNFEISYWFSYLGNQLRTLKPELSAELQYDEDASIDVTMAVWCSKQDIPYAFEYFWSRLSEGEQVSLASRILPIRTWKFQEIMLSTMSSFQQFQLIDQIPIELMTNLVVKCDLPENALIVWTHVKDRITELQFVTFLKNVLKSVIFYRMFSEECLIMLNNVWDTASDRLRKHFAENEAPFMFQSFANCFQYSSTGLTLVLKILSMVNEHSRKEMILHQDKYTFAVRVDDFGAFSSILELCLLEESDRLQFKNLIIESPEMVEHFVEFLNHLGFGTFADRVDRVAFYSPNVDVTRKFINKLLKSDEFDAGSVIVNGEKWNEFGNFIDAVFPNDLSTAREIKKQLILSKMPWVADLI